MTAVQTHNYITKQFYSLTFEEKRHIYCWEGARVPRSVSALVEEHVPPFDKTKWLPICAKKENISEHELEHRWQTINQLACDLGHETHAFMERYSGLQTPMTPQEQAGIKFLTFILKEYEIVAREIRMYSREFGYAGTADLLLRHRKTGELALADYKTNADLFKRWAMLLFPFNYLENHPYNHYQLQFSYYQIMLEEIGLSITKRLLAYLKADATYKIYECYSFVDQLKAHLIERSKLIPDYVAW